MNEDLNTHKPVEGFKKEHLLKGIKPIYVCLINPKDDPYYYADLQRGLIDSTFYYAKTEIHNVRYKDTHDPEKLERLKEKNFLNGGIKTYVISTIDELDKFSQRFYDCSGIVVTGIDRQTGKNVSSKSHQNPEGFLYSAKQDFSTHLRERLSEIKRRCKEGTVDAVVIGGMYYEFTSQEGETEDFRQNYIDSIKFLGKEVRTILGFDPVVVSGPKLSGGGDNIYYSNKDRRLYFVRSGDINKNTRDFSASKIESERSQWDS